MLYIMVPEVLITLNQIVVGLSPILYFQDIELPLLCRVMAYISISYDFRALSTF